MRRTPRASASRLCGRVCAVPLIVGMLLATVFSNRWDRRRRARQPGRHRVPGRRGRERQPETAGPGRRRAGPAGERQQGHRRRADRARQRRGGAAPRWTPAGAPSTTPTPRSQSAQQRFDTFAASTYVNGPSSSYLTAADPADILDTASAGQTLAISAQQVIANLQRARTEQVNKESAARLAKQNADQAAADAQASQDAAVSALTSAQQTFARPAGRAGPADRRAQRRAGQTRRRPAHWSAPAAGRPKPACTPGEPVGRLGPRARGAAPAAGNWDVSLWDPTLPAIPSAFVSGDPIAIINTVLGISSTSAQYTADMGRNFLRKLGILPTPSGYTNGAIPRVYGRQASEYVIQRAGSQMGVPYSWGGGNAAGPSNGIDSGAGTVGFDCSGPDPLRLRGRRHQAAALLGLAVRPRPQDPVIADAPR